MSTFAKLRKRDPPAKKKVGAWLAKSSNVSDNDENQSGNEEESGSEEAEERNGGPSRQGQRAVGSGADDVEESDDEAAGTGDAAQVLENAAIKLKSGKRGLKVEVLESDLVVTSTFPPPDLVMQFADTLLGALPRLVETRLQESAISRLADLVKREYATDAGSGNADRLAKRLVGSTLISVRQASGSNKTVAPSYMYPQLLLALGLFSTLAKIESAKFQSSPLWARTVETIAIALDEALTAPPTDKGDGARSWKGKSKGGTALAKGAITRTRRTIRTNSDLIPAIFDTLFDSSSPLGNQALPLTGLVLAVALRLKPQNKSAPERPGEEYVQTYKGRVLRAYVDHLVKSKSSVPLHHVRSSDDLWTGVLEDAEISEKLMTEAESSLTKFPETVSAVMVHILSIATVDPSSLKLINLIPGSIAASKSANRATRDAAKHLVKAILQFVQKSEQSEATTFPIVEQLLALPMSGKTTNADNRICLLEMLDLELLPTASAKIVEGLAPLVAKETNDAAQTALLDTISTHLGICLGAGGGGQVSAKTISVLVKDLSSNKTTTRRLFYSRLATALWASGRTASGWSLDGWKFMEACLPAFEGSLKTSGTTGPASSSAVFVAPVEAYIVVALAMGPMQAAGASPVVEKFVGQNATLAGLGSTKPKPSFLLSDRIFRKVVADNMDPAVARQGRVWALRAFEALLTRGKKADVDDSARLIAAGAITLMAFEAPDKLSRADAVSTIARVVGAGGWTAAGLHLRALELYISHYRPSVTQDETLEEIQQLTGRTAYSLVTTIAKSGVGSGSPDVHASERAMDLIEDSLIICHHALVATAIPDAWINLAISVNVPLDAFAGDRVERILSRTSGPDHLDASFQQAALDSAATMAFIAPSTYIPKILGQSARELDPMALSYVGPEEVGIWNTEEGQLFVDVLNSKKEPIANKNSKDYAQDKWDQEVRASIAKKKAASAGVSVSKQDQALLDAQAKAEGSVRAKMRQSQIAMRRGLLRIDRLLARRIPELGAHLATMMQLVLGQITGPAALLVGQDAASTFTALSSLCSKRLGAHAPILGNTILRALGASVLNESMKAESLGGQVTRMMHTVSGLALHSPIDEVTAVYCSPLIRAVIRAGGLGTNSEEKTEALEQLTLAVTIYEGLASQLERTGYPRLAIIHDLLAVATSQPGLAKDAVSALVTTGEALKNNANPAELRAFFAGLLSPDSYVRSGCLQAIQPIDLSELDWAVELFVARFDEDEPNANLAESIWEENAFEIPDTSMEALLPFLSSATSAVRSAAARSIAAFVSQYPAKTPATLQALRELYGEKAKILAPEFDRFGMIVAESLDRQDPWESRAAIAQTFEEMSAILAKHHVLQFFEFLVLNQALGDRDPKVRQALLKAGITFIDMHGKAVLSDLVKIFETCLGQVADLSSSGDNVREAVVVLFGRLARHLPTGDARIPRVVDRLLVALETPSEIVQVAVADCLPALIKAMPSESERFLETLLTQLTAGPKYAIRRGAAYGIAGIIKGRGLSLMTESDLMGRLREATQDKKNYESRQGAVFAFETLTSTLGRIFEPYIISVIPLLLTIFGDGNAEVREAVSDAAKVIMSKISGHCVKRILPLLLSGLEEKQWRVKKGSIELLGAMAYCAPKQLSLSLPTIIPELTGVLTDSHAQVRAAANTSLKTFGEVLENPEIKRMQPILLKALADPTAKTSAALTALLGTSFEHYLDSPSLALVIPIIDRGLKERSSELKRKSVQIVGNLSSLTESRDFIPYLEQLMPLVQVVLADPVPEARATAAKALGTLVERLGEENFPSLISKLLQTLRSDTSGVDRQGAAQGLSEVLAGLGMARMEGLLPDIINNATSPRSYVKEGFISLLVYLPATFGQRFGPHLGRIIPPILGGLADESEFVRDASMRAGKMIIANYANRAIELLLPELERGMLDSAWRIRQSSIALTGELLYKVTGISGKVEIEEDEAPTQHADASRKALTEALGQDGRDRVLSHLYIVRQDAVSNVRQGSIHIWKALVHNTPRTTREILPMLVKMIIGLLGSESADQQETASRTLGELCRKNGDRILAEIMPMLQDAVANGDSRTREGACTAFNEIMLTASEDHVEQHEDTIIAAVRKALVDDDSNVRVAAARAFDTMQEYIGPKAIDQTIPTLLEAMGTPGASSETALMALREVMSVRAATVFPTLLPTLTVMPITAFNARALASLVAVAGNALSKRLASVLLPLVKSLETESDSATREELEKAVRSLLASVEDMEGVHALEMLLLGWAKDNAASRRVQACDILATFCEVTAMDTSNYRIDWVRQLLAMYDDKNDEVVEAAWKALDALIRTVEKDRLEDLAVPMRRAIETIGGEDAKVAGFCRAKGIQSVVPVLLAGLLGGTQEQREQAAYGIGDVVQRTSEAAVKPYIIQLTGPLIRVITSGNVAVQIKNAILSTLTVLLEEVPQLVRPFHPQLTRTMIKSASDPASISIRNRAAAGLGELMKHQPRVDPVVTELTTGVKAAESDVAASVAEALAAVCNSAGKSIGETALDGILELVDEAFDERPPENFANAIGKIVAGLSRHHPQALTRIIKQRVLERTIPTPLKSICVYQILSLDPSIFIEVGAVDELGQAIAAYMSFDQPATSRPAKESRDLVRSSKQLAGYGGIATLL